MNVLVTGGGGFVGSHVAEHYAEQGANVTVLDNISRGKTLASADADSEVLLHNWRHLDTLDGIELTRGDIRDSDLVNELATDMDAIVHTAAQVAVTSSLEKPIFDFQVNAEGTLNVLEAARRSPNDPRIAFASTNKVYGENVNEIAVEEQGSRYAFQDPDFQDGVPEDLPIDRTKHTPYGTSKLAADLYAQDYAYTYGLQTGVFRMSCIYGTRQFGNEDQGWVAHFTLSALRNQPLTIYGNGKQVRDILFIDDLVRAFDAFLSSNTRHGVWNIGGGSTRTISLLELLDLIEEITDNRPEISFERWREGDQRVYVSDISKAEQELSWSPKISVREGILRFIDWYEGDAPPSLLSD